VQLANYKSFKTLMAEWVDIALTLAKERLRIDNERHKSETHALKQKQHAMKGTKSRDTTK
jgi:hypothetical protein